MVRISQAIKVQYLNMKPGLKVFWAVILGVTVFQYLMIFYFSPQGPNPDAGKGVIAGHIMAVTIFIAVATWLQCLETFPYTLNLGSTRKEFLVGISVFNYLNALAMSAILIGLQLIERGVLSLFGFKHFFMFVTTEIDASIVLAYLVLEFASIGAVAAGVTLLACIGYRYNWMVLVAILVGLVVLVQLPPVSAFISQMLEYWIDRYGEVSPVAVAGWALIFSVVCYLVAYPLVRGCQVKN